MVFIYCQAAIFPLSESAGTAGRRSPSAAGGSQTLAMRDNFRVFLLGMMRQFTFPLPPSARLRQRPSRALATRIQFGPTTTPGIMWHSWIPLPPGQSKTAIIVFAQVGRYRSHQEQAANRPEGNLQPVFKIHLSHHVRQIVNKGGVYNR